MSDEDDWGIDWAAQGLDDVVTIGQGGQAKVIRGWQENMRRDVAVKVIRLASDAAAVSRFHREVRAIGSLSGDPRIVTVYERRVLGEETGLIFLEYLPGGSLADRLRSGGPMPWSEVVDIGISVAAALEYAHGRGVVHGDVKPDNVLLTADGATKLGDFGIARLIGEDETSLPQLVSRYHAAPEILDGRHRATIASDIFSLGSTLYTLLAGHPPAFGRQGDPQRDLDDLRFKDVPDFVVTALGRALSADPDRRQRSAQELADQLLLGLREHASHAARSSDHAWGVPPPAPSGVPDDGRTAPPAPTPVVDYREGQAALDRVLRARPPKQDDAVTLEPALLDGEPRSRRRMAIIGVLAGAVVAIMLAVIVVTRGGDGPGTQELADPEEPPTSVSGPASTGVSTTARPPVTGTPGAIFEDTFSNASSGWQANSSDKVTYGYTSSSDYQILAKSSNYGFYVYPDAVPDLNERLRRLEGDVRVEVQVRNRSTSLGEFGVICRRDRERNAMYRAVVRPDGTWDLYRIESPSTRLASGKAQLSGASGKPQDIYRIRLDCMGTGKPTVLRLSVNGEVVGEATDADGIAAGHVGMYAGSKAQPQVDVRFDNFLVTRPS